MQPTPIAFRGGAVSERDELEALVELSERLSLVRAEALGILRKQA